MHAEAKEFIKGRLIAANFGNIVTVLMQSVRHKNFRLQDLLSHVVPPLVNNQFRVAEAKKPNSGLTIPVGLILWARVSETVHKRLVETAETPLRLAANDWTSGDNLWIIDAVGDKRFVSRLIQDLQRKEFKSKVVNCKVHSAKGVSNKTLTFVEPPLSA